MSLIKANDLQTTTGGIPTVKGQKLIPTAWVNFNGTGTVAIRDSENVSSITDNGAGAYTVTFTTAMSDANYCITGTLSQAGSNQPHTFVPNVQADVSQPPTTTYFKIGALEAGIGWLDATYVHAAILGGQA